MKKRVGIIFMLCLLVLLAGCSGLGKTTYKVMDMATAQQTITEADVVLVDARPCEEYLSGFIPGAVWLPADDVITYLETQLPDKEKTCWVYGADEKQAGVVANYLAMHGYKDVTRIGSINDWQGDLTVVTPERLQNSTCMALFMSGNYKLVYDGLYPLGKKKHIHYELSNDGFAWLTQEERNVMMKFYDAWKIGGEHPTSDTKELEKLWNSCTDCEGTLQEVVENYCGLAYDSLLDTTIQAILEDDWATGYRAVRKLPMNYHRSYVLEQYCKYAMLLEEYTTEYNNDFLYSLEEAKHCLDRLNEYATYNAAMPDWFQACVKEDIKEFQKLYDAKAARVAAVKKQQTDYNQQKQQSGKGNGSGGSNGSKGSSSGSSGNKGSSSGNKAHGFVGSEDEWEDYDDYMDDYEYWEYRDVDDEDDWEDDWDEDE